MKFVTASICMVMNASLVLWLCHASGNYMGHCKPFNMNFSTFENYVVHRQIY